MNKWTKAAEKLKLKIDAANGQAADFQLLLAALPQGQIKQLLKDDACKVILNKYGITESEG